MNQRVSENEMVNQYIRNLKKKKGDKIHLFREVKNRQKRIDVVEFSRRNHGLGPGHAIEFKVSDWKRGFEQALGNRVIMPFNSLAIWNDFEKNIKRNPLKDEGIGLIIVDYDDFIVELKPKKSKYLIYSNYKKIRDKIKNNLN